ncbi:MAG: hypothetical protein RL291_11 [Pseudomonadota bacterium]
MSATWMSDKPVVNKLPGDRLNLRHGPTNIVLRVWGGPDAMRNAQRLVFRNFPKILPAVVDDLDQLRKQSGKKPAKMSSPTAQRMADAASEFAEVFITPMAAVAGAIAEEVLRMVMTGGDVERAYVNNGGDIALHLGPGQSLTCGIAGDFSLGSMPKINGTVTIPAASGICGIATSGAQGKSFSLGIADSVTVLAKTASQADCAATLIANAVNIDSPAIKRTPAKKLDPDSDLGTMLVTTGVGKLTAEEVATALDAGAKAADAYLKSGRIIGALLQLKGDVRVVGSPLLAAK